MAKSTSWGLAKRFLRCNSQFTQHGVDLASHTVVPVIAGQARLHVRRATGGLDAEREERKLIKEEKEARDRHNFEGMQAIRREGYRKVGHAPRWTGILTWHGSAWFQPSSLPDMHAQRRENLGLPPGDTDPALDELSDDEYTFLEDPPELVEARSRLAAYTYRQGEEEPAGGGPRRGT